MTLTTRRSLYVAFFAALLFLPLISRLAVTSGDYQVHISIAQNMLKTGEVRTPHFLLQAFAICFSTLARDVFNATILTVLIAIAGTANIIYRFIRTSSNSEALSLYFTFALLFACPIAALFPLDGHLYFGYIGINVLHNPTMFLLKPFALLIFICSVKSLDSDSRPSTPLILGYAIITVAAASAKPSFTIIILPALTIMLMIQKLKNERFDCKIPILSIIIPSIAVILIQYMLTYSDSQIQGVFKGKSSIIVAPLTVMTHYSSYLFPKFLFSVLFPLAVAVNFFREVIKDRAIQLSWLLFATGSLYTYLLAESGPRIFDGNFFWSAQIALFILFISTAKFLLKKISATEHAAKSWKIWICTFILSIHLVYGIYFHLAEYAATELHW